MAEESKEQNTPLTLQSFWKILDSKLVSLGIPGALIGVALDFARKSEWKNAGFCMVGAAGVWLIIKVGSKLAPRLDKFLDWIFDNTGIWAKNFWGKITSDFESKYYQRLIYDCREYETEGINQEAFALQNLFVPLKIAQRKADSISNNIIPASVNPLEEQSIGELLVRMSRKDIKQRLVVLGAPGFGKSTLLRYITLMYATRRQRKLHPKVPKLIPVLLQLRKVYEIILKEPKQSLVDLIEKAVENLQSIEPLKPHPGWFSKQLRDGKCLLMLDGLDEIPDDSQRLLVSEWVTKQIDGYNNTPFILTSRPEGYRKAPLQGNVLELEVQPFTHEQRNQFIQDWYLCRKKASNGGKIDLGVRNNAKQKGDKLITQINVSSSLKVMARNPLLLNMIVITYENNGSLSTRRGDLYKEICEVLLERRRREKGLPILLSAEQKLTVLKSLALKLVQENTQAFTLEESSTRDNIFKQAKLLIQEKLDRFPQQGITSEDFIKKDDWGVRELLSQKKQEGIYEFAHKTFQEYLAAVEITTSKQENLLIETFNDEKKLAWWRETILFYAAQTDATNLIEISSES